MKQFKVKIYAPSQRPAATVVLSDQREKACWLPEPLSAEAVFFVEKIEAESEEARRQISAVLFRASAPVWKGGSSVSKRVRTRGDYLASEPYGTPAFWRAAFGLLERETGLTYDLQGYGQMLQGMEAPVIVNRPVETETDMVETIRDWLTGAPSFAFARGGETMEGALIEERELPALDTVVQDLQSDPELLAAFVNLRTAIDDPQMRPNVLAALEAFARAANPKR